MKLWERMKREKRREPVTFDLPPNAFGDLPRNDTSLSAEPSGPAPSPSGLYLALYHGPPGPDTEVRAKGYVRRPVILSRPVFAEHLDIIVGTNDNRVTWVAQEDWTRPVTHAAVVSPSGRVLIPIVLESFPVAPPRYVKQRESIGFPVSALRMVYMREVEGETHGVGHAEEA